MLCGDFLAIVLTDLESIVGRTGGVVSGGGYGSRCGGGGGGLVGGTERVSDAGS